MPNAFPASANPVVRDVDRKDPARNDALLRLVACLGPSAPRRRLLEQASPVDALAAGPSLWRACGLQTVQIAALQLPASASLDAARHWLARPGHHLLGWDDPDYPPLLRQIPAPPLALFVTGDIGMLWLPAIALVGSRSPTPGGRENAGEFARVLANHGMTIASGLAAGIDTAAHHATLAAGGTTVAVLGTGPDVPYPRVNTPLHGLIGERGAIVSEYLPGTGPRRDHFPRRNRILAGLGLGTLVIEAAHRSGALITARLAGEYGREVMALPGSIHNPRARGCHRLIRDGACLIETPRDVIDLLAAAVTRHAGDLRRQLSAPTSDVQAMIDDPPGDPLPASTEDIAGTGEHQKLWQALGHDPTGMDQLVQRTGLTPARLSSMLLPLELEGRVVAQHGRYYRNR